MYLGLLLRAPDGLLYLGLLQPLLGLAPLRILLLAVRLLRHLERQILLSLYGVPSLPLLLLSYLKLDMDESGCFTIAVVACVNSQPVVRGVRGCDSRNLGSTL